MTDFNLTYTKLSYFIHKMSIKYERLYFELFYFLLRYERLRFSVASFMRFTALLRKIERKSSSVMASISASVMWRIFSRMANSSISVGTGF